MAILSALAAIALIPLIGGAFDLSGALGVKSRMQDALDQAVFAGSQAAPLVRNDVARRMFIADVAQTTSIVGTPSFITTPDGVMRGSVTTSVPTLFLGVINVPSLTVSVTSTSVTTEKTTSVMTQSTQLVSTTGSGDKLRWAPPTLKNPITITLGTGDTTSNLKPTQDYIIKLPAKKKVGFTYILGGHNVVILGGYITLPVSADKTNGAPSRAIYIKGATGVVHVEGVLIDASGGGMSDGVDIAAPEATVQVENVRVEGIYGYNNQFHADVIQPFGGVRDLRVDKLTGYSGYQGLTIDQDQGAIGSAELYRVNLVATGAQVWGSANNGGYLLWLTPLSKCQPSYPVTLNNVYVKPRATLANAVWPPVGAQTACPALTTANDLVASFPKLPVSGYVSKGLPPQGDFVPQGVAGLNYRSPGYLG
ncbi:MAG TPA: pilus assembly protein TadG-related protein [Caulobacteraceae bacterium]